MSATEGQMDVHAGGKVAWKFEMGSADGDDVFRFEIATTDENSAEWDITLLNAAGDELWNNGRGRTEVRVDTVKNKSFTLQAICPRGVRYGDTVDITVSCGNQFRTFSAIAKQSLMILKTKLDQEKAVADEIMKKLLEDKKNPSGRRKYPEEDYYAVLAPVGLRGYVFVEGMHVDRINEVVRDIKKAYKFVEGEVTMADIEGYLQPVSAVVGISEGDLVEIINGPFKGEHARVTSIDSAKEEITMELIEAMVPIPVTVKGDSVKLLEK